MQWSNNPYVLPALVGAFIAALLAIFIWRRRPAPGATPSALAMVAITLWCLGYTRELASTDLPAILFWSKVEYMGIVGAPLAWLAFALEYTGRERFLTRRNLALLAIVPLLTLIAVWTNEYHGLIWSHFGLQTWQSFQMANLTYNLGFYIHSTFQYSLLLTSTLLLIQAFAHSESLYRKQAAALLLATLAPWLGNALYLSGQSPFPHLDLTPFSFILTGAAVALGLFRYRLLDIVPVARDRVVENLNDGVIVLDEQNRIVDSNPAAQAILGPEGKEMIGKQARLVFSAYGDLFEKYRNALNVHTEIVLGHWPTPRWFDLRISPLYAGRSSRLSGRILMLQEITERKRSEQELDRLNVSLKNELAERRRADEALQRLNEELEKRVVERTLELEMANDALQEEVAERRKIQEEGERRMAQLEALRQISLDLTSQLDVQSLLTSISDRAVKLIGATTSSFYLYRSDRDLLERVVVHGPHLVNSAPTRRRGEGLIGKVWQTRTPMFVNDYRSWSDRNKAYDNAPSRAVMGVPICWGERFLGVVTIVADPPRTFSTDDVNLLKLFADQTAIALENARLYEDAQREIAERKKAEEEVRELNRILQENAQGLEMANEELEVTNEELKVAYEDLALQVAQTKRAEEEVESLARFPSENPSAVIRIDASGQVLYSNRVGEAFVGSKENTHVPVQWQFQVTEALRTNGQREMEYGHGDHVFKCRFVPIAHRGYVNVYGDDITDRKRAEQALRERQAQIEGIFRSAPIGIGEIVDHRFSMVNDRVAEITGYSMEELIGFHTRQLYASEEDYASTIQAYYSIAVEKGTSLRQIRWRRKDGRMIDVLTGVTPKDRENPSTGAIFTVMDITEHTRTQQALRESEERYHSLFENMLEGFAYCRMIFEDDKPQDLIYLEVNKSFEVLTGLRDVVGKRITQVIPGIRESNPELFEIYGRVALTGASERFETFLPSLGIWFSIAVYSPHKEDFVAVFDNITERKQAETALRESEARLRRFYESGLIGVIYWTTDGKITGANDKFLEMVGYTRKDLEAGAINWISMTPSEYERVDQVSAQELQSTGVNAAPFEKEYIRKDGTRVPVLIAAAMLDEAHFNGVAFVLDVTERKRAEAKMRAALEEKETLLREVHHRVKNNLQAIIALTEMQTAQIREEETQQFLKELGGQARAMSLVYEQLYQSENLSRVDMAPYLRQLVFQILEAMSGRRQIQLELDVASISMDVAEAMPCGLIVNELVTNILKHAFPPNFLRQPEIRVGLHKEADTYRLTVGDNGIGLPSVYDWRTSKSLGLRLVRLWATHQLGGAIQVTGDPGTFYTITFR